jgi:mRNA interferase MazF
VLPGEYGKPRPAVVVQADRFSDDFDSILVCPFTTDLTPHSVARVPVAAGSRTGLVSRSHVMVDKLSVLPRMKVSRVIGRVDETVLDHLNSSLSNFLDLP